MASAHDAVRNGRLPARRNTSGAESTGWCTWTEKFFDRVNHDVLMARVARGVQDRKVLHLIRRFLQAGMMADGVETVREQGTPQGGPLSPLLSNILLTALDQELEKRGLSFCRYADDCNIYVGIQNALTGLGRPFSVNGRGPWWNAAAKRMVAALPLKYFNQLGLVSLVATHRHLQRAA